MTKRDLLLSLFTIALSASVFCLTGLTPVTAQTASLSFNFINPADCSAPGGSVKVTVSVPGACSVNGFNPETNMRLYGPNGNVVASYLPAQNGYFYQRVGLAPGDYYFRVNAISPCTGSADFPFTIEDEGYYYPSIDITTTAVDCSNDDYVTVQNNSSVTVTMGDLNGSSLGTIAAGQSANYPNTSLNYTLIASTQSCPTPVEHPVEYQNQPGQYPFGFPIITANVSSVNTSNGLNNGSATATVTSGAAPFTFEWSNGVIENAPGGVISSTIENLAPGSYSVTVTSTHGCTYTDDFIIAGTCTTISGPTIAGSATVTENATENYSVPTQTGYSYAWTVTGGTIVSGTDTNSIEVQWGSIGQGSVSVVWTDGNGCSSDPTTVTTTIQEPAGIFDHTKAEKLSVYPNPSNGLFSLNLTDTKFTSSAQVIVLDHTGRTVFRSNASQSMLSINLGATAHGIYLIEVREDDLFGTARVSVFK